MNHLTEAELLKVRQIIDERFTVSPYKIYSRAMRRYVDWLVHGDPESDGFKQAESDYYKAAEACNQHKKDRPRIN